MTFVVMTGGIDVSVGAIMVACTATYAVLTQDSGASEVAGLIVMFLVAISFGVLNGISVAYFKMPPFLVTLATQGIGRGVALVLTGGVSYRNLGASFSFIGKESFLGVPLLIWVVALVFVIGYLLLHKTIYGRQVMAIGGNVNAARVSGINVRRVTMSVYILLGIISGIAGFITVARIGSYYAAMGQGMEFMVIAAVVIGGTSLSGGVGSILGTLVGTLLIGIINNSLNLFGVAAEWQDVARGIVIFLAVLFDAIRNKFNFAE
jgi:ribose transport system permease protein